MSWTEEDWTVGLSGRVLKKVKELQIHQERLSRENKQKQLQLDNIHTSLEKQTSKYEEVRVELQSVHRELQNAREENKVAMTNSQRLTQELQTKQAQVCSLEGQLDAARTLSSKLTQELKRLEAEQEKLQNSSRSADTSLFSTPCWNATPPWENNGSLKEEGLGQKDEGQNRALRRLQFTDMATPSLPRQNKGTPQSNPYDQSDSFSTPSAVFPWERNDTRPTARRLSPCSPQAPSSITIGQGQSEQGSFERESDSRKQTDRSLLEMQSRVTSLEEELRTRAETLKSSQNDLVQSKKKLASTELSLQRTRDELSLAHTRMAQESERTSGAEQRLKQLQEELKCQRQNAESSRLQHQQRTKELEKQHQRDVAEFQKEKQCLEKQHHQEVNKLNQELQQARTLHNALQAQADKLSLQKQALDRDLDGLKEKLTWTEEQLQESQKKEALTQAKLTGVIHEAEGVAVSLEQSRKRERSLEEERRRLSEEQADALRLLKELQEQKAALVPQGSVQNSASQNFTPQPPPSYYSRSSTSAKRSFNTRCDQTRQREGEAEKDERERTEIISSYPSDREPGEGIDCEHITVIISPECDTEHLQRPVKNQEESKSKNDSLESDSSAILVPPTCSQATLGSSKLSAPTKMTSDDEDCCSVLSENSPVLVPKQTVTSDTLQMENAILRSELRDAREELQKRLEDLEAQRRSEAEARTRLKQLSRKNASQAVEKEEQDKDLRTQLDRERAEVEMLRKALTNLETEVRRERGRVDQEEEEDGTQKILEDRESEMIQLNIQLKKQLAEVKVQLALECEGRERREEEWNQIAKTENGVRTELNLKLAELTAELEQLKCNRNQGSLEEKKLSANRPLTYLTLCDDELNCNFINLDDKLLPSLEQHLFCQSTNQRNTLVSQATADLIQAEGTGMAGEHSHLLVEGQTAPVVSDLKDTPPQNCLQGFHTSSKTWPVSDFQSREHTSSELMEEVGRLQNENAKQTERANQYQIKLKALQNQVTSQTKQLTMGFEKQSQYITELLAELQEKERTLLCRGEELQRCRQELDALRAEKEGQERIRSEKVIVTEAGCKDKIEEGSGQLETVTSDPGKATLSTSDTDNAIGLTKNNKCNVGSGFMTGEVPFGHWGGTADTVTGLHNLQQENQLLEQGLKALIVPDARKCTKCCSLSCAKQPGTHTEPGDSAETLQSSLQIARGEDEGKDLEREAQWTDERPETGSRHRIGYLQQQLVLLKEQLQALSEKSQQQVEELAVWRLASQAPPTFAVENPIPCPQNMPSSQSQDLLLTAQTHIHRASDHQEQTPLVLSQSSDHVTIIRDDKLFLSCSSSRLHGRMLFSRLKPNSLSDETDIDKNLKNDNHEINNLQLPETCLTQLNGRSDSKHIQLSGNSGQQYISQDLYKMPEWQVRAKPTERDSKNPKSEFEYDISRATSEQNIMADCSLREVRPEMKSVSSQTETCWYLRDTLTAAQSHSKPTQTKVEEDEESDNSPAISPVLPLAGRETGDKVLFSSSFPIPADPARLAERIRRNRTQLSAAFDDTEYEPYGLPEVVMKGFADIPTGPSCPYIVRRGLLGTAAVPVPLKYPEQEETD